MWFLFALIAPALYAVAEIFDEYLSNREFKNIPSLLFYAAMLNIPFVIVVFLIQHPALPSPHLIFPLIGVGLTNILYLYPYYRSLQIEDTSVVSAFFSIGKIFVPILAFLFVGEVLSIKGYIGIVVIIIGNVLLSLHRNKKGLKFSHAFYLIMFASTILGIEGVLFKYMFEHGLGWSTAVGGQLALSALAACSLLLFAKFRKEIWAEKKKFFESSRIFFTEELFTFLAIASEAYAIKLAPVSLVKGVGLIIPLFVLSYTVAVKRYVPPVFHENTKMSVLLKKVPLYILIIGGILLIGVGD